MREHVVYEQQSKHKNPDKDALFMSQQADTDTRFLKVKEKQKPTENTKA
jgi:hypothetical protein